MHLQSSVPPTPSTPTPPVTMFSNPTSVFFRPFPSRWGDLPAIEDDPGIAALEREAVTKPRAMNVEPMKLFQPSQPLDKSAGPKQERKVSGLFSPAKQESEDSPSTSQVPTPRFEVHADPRVIHSLQLNQYMRKMNSLIADASSDAEKAAETVGGKRKLTAASSSSSTPPLAKIPPLPPLPAALTAKVVVKKERPFPPFDPPPAEETLSSFATGRWGQSSSSSSSNSLSSAPPTLTNTTCRQLARKSVITLIAHAGFDNAADSAVDVLTDMLQSYLHQLTSNLADGRDAEMTLGGSNFPDILEKVFTEMGVGSAKSLLRFYDADVVKQHETLQRQADALAAQYRAMTSGEVSSSSQDVRVKTEAGNADSKAWFATGGGLSSAATEDKNATESAVKREFDTKDAAKTQMTTLASTHAIVPSQTTSDTTDYDADDDDVITEPSSVKSIFENDAGNSGGDGADSGYDLVASTLISLSSPGASSNKEVVVKKKKKNK